MGSVCRSIINERFIGGFIMNIILGSVLFLNVSFLTVLVPGGPIENRDFSHMTGFSFWGFNIYLISLGLSSFIISYYLILGASWAYTLALVLGFMYLGVYLLDLLGIFPTSPTAMSNPLMLMEIINALLAVYLIVLLFAKMHI